MQLVDGENKNINFMLSEEAVKIGEVIVEVNRAKERETPVAFSDVGTEKISRQLHTQDAPLLIKNIPGVFSYSTDGVGNGESKLYVRGFDQNHVQVLINGIPTNDPESNAVYWSNWGAVSSAAASVQVQRGAGSSLYGAGSFGGSFNIITQEVPARAGLEAHATFGNPEINVYGASIHTGLLANNLFAAGATYDWKTGRGDREGAYYQGANYYFGIALYPDEKSAVKLVLHGGPQEHGYSNTAPIAYFKKYGYTANPTNFLPIDVLNKQIGAKTLEDSLNLTGDSRLLRDSKYLTLAHNFYHKPQLELHMSRDINDENSVRATFFYSVGRGGGSSVSSTVSSDLYLSDKIFGADTSGYSQGLSAYQNLNLNNGVISTNAQNYIANKFLKNAYQKIAYSLHRQWGVIASWDMQLLKEFKITLGGEYRDWFADHPGYFTNLYGKSSITAQKYSYQSSSGAHGTFYRRNYQGDMDFGGPERIDVNYLNPFMDYTLKDDGGTYNTQYRNYIGQTKQGTIFIQANYKYDDIKFIGSIQYARYNYRLKENMPGGSAIGDSTAAPVRGIEGKTADGFFYMKSSAATPIWYRFQLVDQTRTRGFWQPKIGLNYNITEAINAFVNYSHVERLVDLGVWYNDGNPNVNADDEKSNQAELGIGYKDAITSARLNAYRMTWDNKTAFIKDPSKASTPGYDPTGQKYELVGSSRNQGLEFEGSYIFDELFPIKGLSANLSISLMDNMWTKVLDKVKTDATGKRRAFNTDALNAAGIKDTLFFDELEGQVNASTPFTTIAYGLTYENDLWFAAITGITSMDYYAYDGGTYIAVDGHFDNSTIPKFIPTYSNKLPSSTVFDFQVGMYLKYNQVKARVTAQVLNIFDKQYLVSLDRYGVLPGITRSFRINLGVGI
jgi:outer membrane receptor protein involved in Fe transport